MPLLNGIATRLSVPFLIGGIVFSLQRGLYCVINATLDSDTVSSVINVTGDSLTAVKLRDVALYYHMWHTDVITSAGAHFCKSECAAVRSSYSCSGFGSKYTR